MAAIPGGGLARRSLSVVLGTLLAFGALPLRPARAGTPKATSGQPVGAPPPGIRVFLRKLGRGRGAGPNKVVINRAPPRDLSKKGTGPLVAEEVLYRIAIEGDPSALPAEVRVSVVGPGGKQKDTQAHVGLMSGPCPSSAKERAGKGASDKVCGQTPPLALVVSPRERFHPSQASSALLARLGDRLEVSAQGASLGTYPVVGPIPFGKQGARHGRVKLRLFAVRQRRAGPPPFGQSDKDATRIVREQVALANGIWSQCGIDFGSAEQAKVLLVDPPQTSLLAVGCGLAMPAKGDGLLKFKAQGHRVQLTIRPGERPPGLARRVAAVLKGKGFRVALSKNRRIGPSALGSVDLLITRGDGRPVSLKPGLPEGFSDDSNLRVCANLSSLGTGLRHFTDVDAVAGTVEERSLLKRFDDGDPRTLEVVFLPAFATGSRIGESFIFSDRSSLANMVLVDRAGVRAGSLSFTLAHEIGHVLLDLAGHSDDLGKDTPTRLMDSDAADGSILGPRHLTWQECLRAKRQSGTRAAIPMIQPVIAGPLARHSVARPGKRHSAIR